MASTTMAHEHENVLECVTALHFRTCKNSHFGSQSRLVECLPRVGLVAWNNITSKPRVFGQNDERSGLSPGQHEQPGDSRLRVAFIQMSKEDRRIARAKH